jgi:hypothetical protein
MQVKHSSIEPYIRLLQSMEADLHKIEQDATDGDQYRNIVQVVVLGIRELGKLVASGFVKEEEEIALFHEACIWGLVYKGSLDFLQG